jgi:glycosyltransferase involved in cell wall biosynthesis
MKKKLLFVISSLVGGGAENALVKLLKALDYTKYEISLLVICYRGVYINQIPDEVKVLYLFRNKSIVRGLEFLQKRMGWPWPLKIKFESVVNDDYDTAISFLDCNFTDLLFYLKKETKKIAFVHSSYISNENFNKFYKNKNYLERVKKNRYGKLDTIVFVSNDAMLEFKKVMGEYHDMRVLYNLFDEENILQKAQASVASFNPEIFHFVAVGSLLPVKGYDLLIDASAIVKQSGNSFQVHIVGRGSEEEKLKKRVQDLGLNDIVVFHGYQNNPFAYINEGDVFVMTSVSEALPSVLCEAIIIGKPTLITNTAGCREVIDFGKYGVMTERNAKGFAHKMIEFIDNKQMMIKYKKLSLERKKIFNKEIILEKFHRLIN